MPIVGRVLDLEGRPVPGVTVRPVILSASPDEDLSAWEAAMAGAKDHPGRRDRQAAAKPGTVPLGGTISPPRPVPTGGFALTGIGRERVVSLWIEGPTIATAFVDIHARTRPGPTYRLALQRDKPELARSSSTAPRSIIAAAPTRPIEGTVRDKDTGRPLAGISIRSDRFAGNVISGRDHVRTTTGADGRYPPGGDAAGAATGSRPTPARRSPTWGRRRRPRRSGPGAGHGRLRA